MQHVLAGPFASPHRDTHPWPRHRLAGLIAIVTTGVLAGCAVTPSSPSMTALPGSGRSLEQFRIDDQACRRATSAALSGQTPQQAANASVAAGAVGGAALGALAGAALGGSRGASVGAGTGLLMGSITGSAQAPASAQRAQFGFDQIYFECMYRAGHRVPVRAASVQSSPPYRAGMPSGAMAPTPPPGLPPAPPPGLAAPLQRSAPVITPAAPGGTQTQPDVPVPPPGTPPAPPRTWRSD